MGGTRKCALFPATSPENSVAIARTQRMALVPTGISQTLSVHPPLTVNSVLACLHRRCHWRAFTWLKGSLTVLPTSVLAIRTLFQRTASHPVPSSPSRSVSSYILTGHWLCGSERRAAAIQLRASHALAAAACMRRARAVFNTLPSSAGRGRPAWPAAAAYRRRPVLLLSATRV